MSEKRIADAFWARVGKRGPDECWEWTGPRNQKGYGNYGRRSATHLSLEMDGRPRTAGLLALHSCDNPPCVNPAHLRWGTPAENTADMYRRGRESRHKGLFQGERNQRAKLTPEQVLAIRADRRTQHQLARAYGVAQPTIACIKTGRTWSHLQEPQNADQ